MFTNFDKYMGEKDPNRQVISPFQQHLQSLTEYFNFYYPSEKSPSFGNMQIIDLFVANIKERKLSIPVDEKNLCCDKSVKVKSNHLYQNLISGSL